MLVVKRKAIIELLNSIEIDKPILFPYSSEELRNLVFDKKKSNTGELYYVFNSSMLNIAEKIDFSNISFDNVEIKGIDFSKLHGIKINPQKIYEKNLEHTTLSGVEIIGNDNLNETDLFEGVKIDHTSFYNSKGAKINPQTIHNKRLWYSNFADVDFTGFSFDGTTIHMSSFKGSKGAKFNPNKVNGADRAILADVELTDLPECAFSFQNYTGSNYEELQNIKNQYIKQVFELIKEQVPKKKEEPIEEQQVQSQEIPKQKRKWFGNN